MSRTAEEVLEVIRRNSKPGDWRASGLAYKPNWGPIRHVETGECPLCFTHRILCPDKDRLTLAWQVAYRDMGMEDVEARRVAYGADWWSSVYRQKVMEACHLTA